MKSAVRGKGLTNMPDESFPFLISPRRLPSYSIGQNWVNMATTSYKGSKEVSYLGHVYPANPSQGPAGRKKEKLDIG